MLTREEIETIISNKNGGIEAYLEVSRVSWKDGYSCGYSDGQSNTLNVVEDYLKFEDDIK